ncbi:MAG: polysaccharide deacetylase family protein [Candidatus Wallbacteria bacterium]|nr:polysaccharide deacetylase family protein [Candidatus Wallbacteria bacterium]
MHILTVDLEDYYHPNLMGDKGTPSLNSTELSVASPYLPRIVQSTETVLAILDQYKARATFFVLGEIAELEPGLIRRISAEGHEIASHGYQHELLYQLPLPEAVSQIERSKKMLEDLTGKPVHGFRAPSWSILPGNIRLLDELKTMGFTYDSSLFPARTWLYGDFSFSREIRQLENGLLEFPPSCLNLIFKRIPFSGGIYFRTLPFSLIKMGFRQAEKDGKRVVTYFHPWEFDQDQPRLNLNIMDSFIHYHNLAKTGVRLKKLLSMYQFVQIHSVIPVDHSFTV